MRTRRFRSNSSSSWTTRPKPVRSHSNLVPSPIGPSVSWRELLTVGFHSAKRPPSTTVSKTSPTGRGMTWLRVRTATALSVLEHCCERAGIEEHADLRDPSVPHVVPLCCRSSSSRRAGHEVVDDTHIVAIDEDLPFLDPLHDLGQPSQGADVGVSVVESVDRPAETHVVVQQTAS